MKLKSVTDANGVTHYPTFNFPMKYLEPGYVFCFGATGDGYFRNLSWEVVTIERYYVTANTSIALRITCQSSIGTWRTFKTLGKAVCLIAKVPLRSNDFPY